MSVTFYYDFKDLQWFFAFFQLFFKSNMMTRSMHAARGLCNFTTSSRVSFGKPHAADERRQRWRSRWGCSLCRQSGPIQPDLVRLYQLTISLGLLGEESAPGLRPRVDRRGRSHNFLEQTLPNVAKIFLKMPAWLFDPIAWSSAVRLCCSPM